MDEKTLIAFRMKFQSKPYTDIAAATGFTEGTIRQYFANGGEWRDAYDTWAEQEADTVLKNSRQLFQGAVEIAVEEMISALEHARDVVRQRRKELAGARDTGKITAIETAEQNLRSAENRVIEIGEKVMDKVGMGAIIRTKSETPAAPGATIDDVKQRLTDAGIDPTSIRFTDPAPPRAQGVLPN